MTDQATATTASTARTLDDFAEYLTNTYTALTRPLADAGVDMAVARVGAGCYLMVAEKPTASPDARVEVTDQGRPLPARPEDVTEWAVHTSHGPVRLPGATPAAEVAAVILTLLGRRHVR